MPAASVINISSMYVSFTKPSLYPSNIPLNPLLWLHEGSFSPVDSLSIFDLLRGIRVNSVSYGPFPSSDVQNNSPEFVTSLGLHTTLVELVLRSPLMSSFSCPETFLHNWLDISVDSWTAW